MLHVVANNGIAPRAFNPYDPADVVAVANTTSISVVVFGAGKASILRDTVARLEHFAYVFGYQITIGEITSKQTFRITVEGLVPGTAHLWAVIVARLAGRQRIREQALKLNHQRSRIRHQLIKQIAPSVCDNGSDLRDCTAEALYGNEDYVTYIEPLFLIYGLHQHGSVALPA